MVYIEALLLLLLVRVRGVARGRDGGERKTEIVEERVRIESERDEYACVGTLNAKPETRDPNLRKVTPA